MRCIYSSVMFFCVQSEIAQSDTSNKIQQRCETACGSFSLQLSCPKPKKTNHVLMPEDKLTFKNLGVGVMVTYSGICNMYFSLSKISYGWESDIKVKQKSKFT